MSGILFLREESPRCFHPSCNRVSMNNMHASQILEILEMPNFLLNLIEDLLNGILLLDRHGNLLYSNDYTRQIFRQLGRDPAKNSDLPQEIWYIYQSLLQSRNLFPNQRWLMAVEVLLDNSIVLKIRAQWMNLHCRDDACLLLILEDQKHLIRNVVTEEAQKYGLTSREREIWMLYRANFSYKEIAIELGITPHTVKKHMKSIRAKQKNLLDLETDP